MNISHLPFPDHGWGYMPPTEEVFSAFRFCQQKFRPRRVLEIGFHMGHSTTYQLEIYKNAKLVSISPYHDTTGKVEDRVSQFDRHEIALDLEQLYPNRWTWIPGKTEYLADELKRYKFDFALVDGLHSYEHAYFDINTCIDLGIKNMLLDNFETGGVRKAFKHTLDLKLQKVFNYNQTFKGKTKTNQIALVKLDRRQLSLV